MRHLNSYFAKFHYDMQEHIKQVKNISKPLQCVAKFILQNYVIY